MNSAARARERRERFAAERRRTVPITGMVTAAILAYAGAARADESDAERLFREGRALMLEGRFEEACPKIAESQRVEPRVGTLLNLAVCHERRGRLALAWDEYQKALAQARGEHQVDRARLAEQRIATLEPRLSWLRVTVPESPRDLAVTVDGTELEPAAVGISLPVDPGVHTIVAAAKGKGRVFEERVDLREGDRRHVNVEVVGASEGPPPSMAYEPLTATDGGGPRPAPPRGWIFEVGLFLDYVRGSIDTHDAGNAKAHRLDVTVPDAPMYPTSCETFQPGIPDCGFVFGLTSHSGGGGVSGFVGHALTDRISAGVRALVGAHGNSKGVGRLVAAGPALRVRVAPWMELGVWGVIGALSIPNTSPYLVAPPSQRFVGGRQTTEPEGTAELSQGGGTPVGAGVEVSCPITKLGSGHLVATTTPFFLTGEFGEAVLVPLGLAYRFD